MLKKVKWSLLVSTLVRVYTENNVIVFKFFWRKKNLIVHTPVCTAEKESNESYASSDVGKNVW